MTKKPVCVHKQVIVFGSKELKKVGNLPGPCILVCDTRAFLGE